MVFLDYFQIGCMYLGKSFFIWKVCIGALLWMLKSVVILTVICAKTALNKKSRKKSQASWGNTTCGSSSTWPTTSQKISWANHYILAVPLAWPSMVSLHPWFKLQGDGCLKLFRLTPGRTLFSFMLSPLQWLSSPWSPLSTFDLFISSFLTYTQYNTKNSPLLRKSFGIIRDIIYYDSQKCHP